MTGDWLTEKWFSKVAFLLIFIIRCLKEKERKKKKKQIRLVAHFNRFQIDLFERDWNFIQFSVVYVHNEHIRNRQLNEYAYNGKDK